MYNTSALKVFKLSEHTLNACSTTALQNARQVDTSGPEIRVFASEH